MSGLTLDALGLQPDPEGQASATPAADPAPATPAVPAPAEATPAEPAAPAVEPEEDDDIVVPEGAQNPDAVRSLIQAERSAARAAYKRAREAEARLAAIEEAGKPLEERLSLSQQREEDARLEAMRLRVGMKHNLPLTFTEMLKGDDEQTLEQNAQAVLAELESRKSTPSVPGLSLNGGPQTPAPTSTDPAKAHNNFLAEAIRRHRTGA